MRGSGAIREAISMTTPAVDERALASDMLTNPTKYEPPAPIKEVVMDAGYNHTLRAADLSMASLGVEEGPAARVAMAASVARLERSGEYDFSFLDHHTNKHAARISALEYENDLLKRTILKILEHGIQPGDAAEVGSHRFSPVSILINLIFSSSTRALRSSKKSRSRGRPWWL